MAGGKFLAAATNLGVMTNPVIYLDGAIVGKGTSAFNWGQVTDLAGSRRHVNKSICKVSLFLHSGIINHQAPNSKTKFLANF